MLLQQKLLLLKEAARGLHAAHRNGLIHRDVKPANILVERSDTGNWKPYVMDFGLARAADSAGMTVTGAVLGTPHYMPPEQARGQLDRVDRRSDVYGLGASLYELLAGQPPFPGDTPTAVLMKVLEDVPETLNRPGSHVPIDVDAIVMKCLRKDPQERYSSARALAEDIQRYLDGEPVEASSLELRVHVTSLLAAAGDAADIDAAAAAPALEPPGPLLERRYPVWPVAVAVAVVLLVLVVYVAQLPIVLIWLL